MHRSCILLIIDESFHTLARFLHSMCRDIFNLKKKKRKNWNLYFTVSCHPYESQTPFFTKKICFLALLKVDIGLWYTVWKIQNFRVTKILREIDFGEYQSSKNAIFTILRALKLWFCVVLAFKIAKIHKKSKFRASKCVKKAVFGPLKFLKLISRKIWVIEKIWNFHTVW